MSAPTFYALSYDFTGFQTANPTIPLPADKIEIEFNNIATTTEQIIDNLALIQRADGELFNGVVKYEALSNDVKVLLGSAILPRGDWITGRAYAALDLINQAGSSYICAVAHTSGVFATDFAAGRWVLWAAGGSVTINNSNWSGTDLSVSNGGTGRSLHTAYALICGGTTTTNAQQSVASVGTAGQVLMSAGAGALPGFQTFLIDEDSFATNSATLAPSQQSVKAYVDDLRSDVDNTITIITADGFITYPKILDTEFANLNDILGEFPKLMNAAAAKLITSEVLLQTIDLSSPQAVVDFTVGFDPTKYKKYIIEFDGVVPATNDAIPNMLASFNGGAAWQTSYRYIGLTTSSAFALTAGAAGISNGANSQFSGKFEAYSQVVNTRCPHCTWHTAGFSSSGAIAGAVGSGLVIEAGIINALRFQFSTGNIAAGNFRLWGLRK